MICFKNLKIVGEIGTGTYDFLKFRVERSLKFYYGPKFQTDRMNQFLSISLAILRSSKDSLSIFGRFLKHLIKKNVEFILEQLFAYNILWCYIYYSIEQHFNIYVSYLTYLTGLFFSFFNKKFLCYKFMGCYPGNYINPPLNMTLVVFLYIC